LSYLVLARKYRPQTFQDLIGQEHVARTLANAIAQDRVAHAFLFTGVRGVGKTTSARLLAKCLNCVGADGSAKGPTATPCLACGPCKEIAAGSDIDVQEIDGASYNGVDEVRRLQEGIAFRPARDRFKIYIVDEVHMLSNAAWNAFLKTLEEPPPHVKFIFATTEVHKVPVTILSRCQRYDFKLISTPLIASRLKEVLGVENIDADPAAVAVLAREAAGSMRDGMSLLDQVIAYSGAKMSAEDVARVLGVADRAILHELATALVGGDAAAALRVVGRLAEQGFDLGHVARDILRHLRNLVVAKVCGKGAGDLLDLADEEQADVVELAASADADDLTRLFQGFSRSFDEVIKSGQPRDALEMTLVRLARRPPLLPLDELLARLGDLERRVGGGGPPTAGAPTPRGGGGAGGSSGPRTPSGSRPSDAGSGPRTPSGPRHSDEAGRSAGMSAPSASNAPVFTAPNWPNDNRLHEDRTRGALALAAEPTPEPVPPPRKLAPTPAQPVPLAGPDLDAWRGILEIVRAKNMSLASVFEHAVPLEVGMERVLVGYEQNDLMGIQAAEPEALDALKRAASRHFGTAVPVAVDRSLRGSVGASVHSIEAAKRREEIAAARAAVEKHPLVQEAMRLFGAELREVRLPSEE
jgi:DNA polymerase-3 subunit gamma/tau